MQKTLAAGILSTLLFAPVASADQPPVKNVVIRLVEGQMRYDLEKIEVEPGQKVKLMLDNVDGLPHNWVLCKPANDKGLDLAKTAWALAEKGTEKGWIPDDPRVLAASKMVDPHTKGEVEFTAPAEPGNYPYVCTFPGHAMSMNGVLNVSMAGTKISNLQFKLYQGDWNALPDFSKLQPFKSGELPDGVVEFKFGDYKNHFGVEYTGKLKTEKEGEYIFNLASDDGGRLFVDGKEVIGHDGIHGAGEVKTGKVTLTAGEHDFRLAYFQKTGEAELFASWQGPTFSETKLSAWSHPSRGGAPTKPTGGDPAFTLAPNNGEAVIYRNFIKGSSPRGIAVGYPSGMNLCFDADQMNLAMMWRGAFIDARQHWTDRGGGEIGVLGYGMIQPNPISQGIATLADPATAWPNRESRAAGVKFLGYELDTKRQPTFHWTFGDLKVAEHYATCADYSLPGATITRVLTLTGKAPAQTFFRLAVDGSITEEGKEWKVGQQFAVSVTGATPKLRESGGKKELLLPAAQGEILVTYKWAN